VQGPGAFQFDISLVRAVRMREKHTVEFRAEAFNVPNHVRPMNPNASISTPTTFGKITLYQDPRIMQFALKYLF
jgi:hypothetical protein